MDSGKSVSSLLQKLEGEILTFLVDGGVLGGDASKCSPDSAVTHKEGHWGKRGGVTVSLILTLCKTERKEREKPHFWFELLDRKPLGFSFSKISTSYYSKGGMFCVSSKCYKEGL